MLNILWVLYRTTSLKISDYIKINDGRLKDLLGVLAGSSYTTIITLVVTRTRLPEREGNEIEIHGTWIQYRCVRSGTVDLGYYYVRGRIGNLDTVF